MNSEGTLFIVATPIGNLEDITLRAIRLLREADVVACEDTRVTGNLLKHYGIESKRLISCYSANEQARITQIINLLREGKSVALTSDAGTPGISDPGARLISAVIAQNIRVVAIPGAAAFINGLVISGFATDEFLFLGFVPHKKGRQTLFKKIAEETRTVVLYESPHRLLKTLKELIEHTTETRRGAVCRELTKMYEEVNRGTLAQLLFEYSNRVAVKGEFVLVIEGVQKIKQQEF